MVLRSTSAESNSAVNSTLTGLNRASERVCIFPKPHSGVRSLALTDPEAQNPHRLPVVQEVKTSPSYTKNSVGGLRLPHAWWPKSKRLNRRNSVLNSSKALKMVQIEKHL